MQKVRWGVLGVSKIATTKVIPAMQRGEWCKIAGIASRDRAKAQEAARSLGIPKAYGSYEEMLEDPEIEAVYNPLPNHMHVPWSIRAAEAGKHVLCEKPIGMNVAETLELMAARDRTGVVMGEAFMVQSHPQWLRTMELVRAGRIGQLRSAVGSFSYFKLDAGNIRNIREYGGGGLMDIGCYCINFARLFAGAEPTAIHAAVNFHPGGVDELAVATLVFPNNIVSSFTCGMCLHADNTAYLCGEDGFIEVPVPWKPAPDNSKFIVTRGNEPKMDKPKSVAPPPREVRSIDAPGDLYQMEADDFAAAVLDSQRPRITPEDSVGNMRVLDEMRRQIGLEF